MPRHAFGRITVEPHEKTGGIRIERETPELRRRKMGPVIIPGGDLETFANDVSDAVGKELVDPEVAQLMDLLQSELCE